MNINHNLDATLADAQREVVCGLLPRTHDVTIAGRYVVAGLLVPLTAVPAALAAYGIHHGEIPVPDERELAARIFDDVDEDQDDDEPPSRCASAHLRSEECPECS